MATIINNYNDIGFGSPEIVFDATVDGLDNPFSLASDQNQYNLGFSSSNIEIATETSDLYKNYFSFNYGSNIPIISQIEKKYTYDEIIEKGTVSIEKNSFIDVRSKSSLIRNPVFICTPVRNKTKVDISIHTEKINNKTFRIFNDSDIKINVDYISSQTNVSISSINTNESSLNSINLDMKNTLS